MGGYIGASAGNLANAAERKQTYTITTATTSLTGLAYTPTKVHVFHNGVRLVDGTDYTATNGTSITLTNAAQNGDEVVVISYPSFQTSDTVSAANGGTFAGNVTFSGTVDVNGNNLILDADGDSKIEASTDDTITVHTAGSERMRIASDGKVGTIQDLNIGNNDSSNPVSKLRFGATLYGAADIVPVSTGHKVGLDFKTDSTGDTTIDPVTRMTISNEGYVTKSFQPAFSAYRDSSTTEGLNGTIVFNGTRSNIGSHYNTSTGKFTAPVAGLYQFNFVGFGSNSTGGVVPSATAPYVTLYNETTSTNLVRSYSYIASSTSHPILNFSGMVPLAANNVVRIDVGGAYVYSDASDVYLTFSGYLVG